MILAPQDISAAKYRLDSWSQEGEDLVLRRFFEQQPRGFYIDIGAHHPHQFSNTFWFYKRGWRGINIDALPGSMEAFELHRPEDLNLEVAISDEREMTYFMFNHSALNSLNREVSERRDGKRGDRIVGRVQVQTRRLGSLLDEILSPGRIVDFLSVDVEGHDLAVLRSNDWSKYRPRIVLAEDLQRPPLDELSQSQLVRFMRDNGYRPCARTFNTLFFETH
jgi:FkbM family methyltransferase